MSIYMDYNATTPMDPKVIRAVSDAFSQAWANPSSDYESGRAAKKAIFRAKREVAEMMHLGDEGQIIFTSGGTEANLMAINSALHEFYLWREPRVKKFRSASHDECPVENDVQTLPHVITSNIEHVSILLPLKKLVEKGKIEVDFVSAAKNCGFVKVQDILDKIKPNTCLVTIMLANNETGLIQPVFETFNEIRKINTNRINSADKPELCMIRTHSDAAQAVGKIDVNIQKLHVDYLTIAGHKFYGPRIGALFYRYGCHIEPLFLGGGQENFLRAGTENTPLIIGLGCAANLVATSEISDADVDRHCSRIQKLRRTLESRLVQEIKEARINFSEASEIDRLPNTVSVSFEGVLCRGSEILSACMGKIEASTTAACHSGSEDLSSVLINSGLSNEAAMSTIRLSLGRQSTKHEIDNAVQIIKSALSSLALSSLNI